MKNLFVVSAPSGAGKTSICRRVLAQREDLCYATSYTTRRPRPHEIKGQDYHFVSRDTFQEMIANDEFLEWAEVFGDFYGTLKSLVMEQISLGFNVLLDMDTFGAEKIKKQKIKSTFIFIIPPSYDILIQRLKDRNTESQASLKKRLNQVNFEISRRHIYDYLLINDDLDDAVKEMLNILDGHKGLPMESMEEFWLKFFKNHQEIN